MSDINARTEFGLDPTKTPTENRVCLQAAIDAGVAQRREVYVPAGDYGLADDAYYGWVCRIPGDLTIKGDGVSTILHIVQVDTPLQPNGWPGANGFVVTDDTAGNVTMRNLQIQGPGVPLYHGFHHAYAGSLWCNVVLDNVKISGSAYAVKCQGGRTNMRHSNCDLSGWVTSYLHTHAVTNAATGATDVTKIGAAIDIFGGKYNSISLPGAPPQPGPFAPPAQEHGIYINPAFDVTLRGTTFETNNLHAYQCNGPQVPNYGSLRLYDCVVAPTSNGGIHTHPLAQTIVSGGSYKPINIAFNMRAGGLRASDAIVSPVGGRFDWGQPMAAFHDNESMDVNGLLLERITMEFNPAVAMLYKTRPGKAPWVVRDSILTQKDGTSFAAYAVYVQPNNSGNLLPTDANIHFHNTMIDWKYGRLWHLDAGAVFVRDQTRVKKGANVQDSVLAAGAYADLL